MSESEYALECSVSIRPPNNGTALGDHDVRAIACTTDGFVLIQMLGPYLGSGVLLMDPEASLLLAREMIGMAALAYQHRQGKREEDEREVGHA